MSDRHQLRDLSQQAGFVPRRILFRRDFDGDAIERRLTCRLRDQQRHLVRDRDTIGPGTVFIENQRLDRECLLKEQFREDVGLPLGTRSPDIL